MSATKSTQNIQIRILTGDGLSGFWSYRRDNSTSWVKDFVYNNKDSIIKTADKLDYEDTFYEAVKDFKNDSLPTEDQKTNVNKDSPPEQFEHPLLTNSGVDDIAGWFDTEDFCCKMGALLMVKRFLNQSHLNWSGSPGDSDDIYIYLGQKRKASKDEVFDEVDLLLYEGTITKPEYDTFSTRWTNEVENA